MSAPAITAEHCKRRRRLDVERVEHRADTGLDAATERTRELEWERLRHGDGVAFGNQRERGERRLLEERAANGALGIGQRHRAVGPLTHEIQLGR
jgi:hypothetical protein